MSHHISYTCFGVVSLLCTQDLTCPLYEAVAGTQSHAGSSPAQGENRLLAKAPSILPELGFAAVPESQLEKQPERPLLSLHLQKPNPFQQLYLKEGKLPYKEMAPNTEQSGGYGLRDTTEKNQHVKVSSALHKPQVYATQLG